MKRSLIVLLFFSFVAAALESRAQVVPSATSRRMKVQVGAEGSMFQPDVYDQVSSLDFTYPTVGTAPNRLYGAGVYGDVDFTRWIQIEVEARWLHWNKDNSFVPTGFVCPSGETCQNNAENTYMIGPRVPIHNFKGFTPYGKFLVGWGSGRGWLDGRALALAYGGGVDYKLSRRFSARFDFEYQQWRVAYPGESNINMFPYGGSVGLSYRVF